ncbi:DUF3013 family protein [Streptococcus suis]|uniref:DUF3013 family protein n=1 Tax=Streptococcus suis TaxID=1307 RepID=UPI0004182590|nr:DUF3013 family protein [Streptococcus suis]MCH1638229.1 DUF3013 family protein [Streptococcus suis]MCH1649057.1 DUF3013 family protein [Streptococcus suis]MCK3976174.1 DUF3013 family protein [Streptococcus suis]MDY7602463.1 DUF3013 family protein [Streptococcus suis]TQE46268.1 DUF3013 family protein [Streptococcus suis]
MAKHGFLDVLEVALDKHFTYDYELNWDKKNHAVELAFILEAQNASGIETVDDEGNASSEDIFLEEYVLFYNQDKSHFDEEDYLVALPFDAKKGFSAEFLTYFAGFLKDTADQGLDDLMDFLVDPEAQEFAIAWDSEAFEKGRADLVEGEFYPYPRY